MSKLFFKKSKRKASNYRVRNKCARKLLRRTSANHKAMIILSNCLSCITLRNGKGGNSTMERVVRITTDLKKMIKATMAKIHSDFRKQKLYNIEQSIQQFSCRPPNRNTIKAIYMKRNNSVK